MKYWGTQLQVSDADVIAVDQEQRPALIGRRVGNGGYFVLANHSRDTLKTRITTTLPARMLEQLTPAGTTDVAKDDDNGWIIEMPAYGGAVAEWRKIR